MNKWLGLVVVTACAFSIGASSAHATAVNQSCTATSPLVVGSSGAPSCSASFVCPAAAVFCSTYGSLSTIGTGLVHVTGELTVDGAVAETWDSGLEATLPGHPYESAFRSANGEQTPLNPGQRATATCRLTSISAVVAVTLRCQVLGEYFMP